MKKQFAAFIVDHVKEDRKKLRELLRDDDIKKCIEPTPIAILSNNVLDAVEGLKDKLDGQNPAAIKAAVLAQLKEIKDKLKELLNAISAVKDATCSPQVNKIFKLLDDVVSDIEKRTNAFVELVAGSKDKQLLKGVALLDCE